jgi:HEAT repeat protein
LRITPNSRAAYAWVASHASPRDISFPAAPICEQKAPCLWTNRIEMSQKSRDHACYLEVRAMLLFRALPIIRIGWAGLITIAVSLGQSAAARAQYYAGDPVEELRQTLKGYTTDLVRGPEKLAARKEALARNTADLRTIGDLRRALLLHEWLDEDQDRQLAQVDREARDKVVERLQRALRRVLKEGDAPSQMAAATMIGEMGMTIHLTGTKTSFAQLLAPDLVETLGTGTPDTQEAAARALGLINPDPKVAMPALERALQKGSVDTRRAAGEAFVNLVQKISQISRAKGQSVLGVQSTPAEVVNMGAMAVRAAAHGLNDKDVQVRRHCLDAFRSAAVALTESLPSLERRGVSYDSLGVSRSDQLLFEEFADVTALAEALADQGPALDVALKASDVESRILAARTLEFMADAQKRLGHRAPAPPVPGSRASLDNSVLIAAALESTDFLEAQVNPAHRAEDALKKLQDRLPALIVALQDPESRVRLAVLDVLETMAEDAGSATGVLIKVLNDPDPFVRWSAMRTLSRIGPAKGVAAVEPLTRHFNDRDLDVRLASMQVIERFGAAGKDAVPALINELRFEDPQVRLSALRALGGIGEAAQAAVPAVADSLSHSDVRVRRMAAEVLGRFGPATRLKAEEPLKKALEDSDADVRKAASDALLNALQRTKEK